ncbi:spermatogenesis-associated protein 31G1 [Phascolarctos cinereus]
MEWVRMLTAKVQLGLIWGEIKEALLPLGCSQCGCSCPQSPGNLLILLLFLVWQFRRNRHQWLPTKQDGSQSMVLPFLFPTSSDFLERIQSWQPQSRKRALFHKEEEEEEEEEEEQEDEEEKEEDMLGQMRLAPWWYFHPRKMEAEQKALGTLKKEVGNLHPLFLGPHGAYQPLVDSKEFPVKTVTPKPRPNSHYPHSSTGLIQAPTSLCPLSISSAKAKEYIQLFWGLPSLHSESLGVTFPKSQSGPTGTTNQHPPSDTPLIFFNELSYLPLPNLLVKTVSLPPPHLPSISPLPVLHGNCEATEMASTELPNEPEIPWQASEPQNPILPLLSASHSPVKPQEAEFMEVTKVMASDEHEVPGPQEVQPSELPWTPESLVQTPSPPSVPLPIPQDPVEDPKVTGSEALLEDQWQNQFPQDPDPSAPALNASPPCLLEPQGASLMGASHGSETAPLTLHGPKASCYNTQQSELPWAAETPASCLSLHTSPEPQGTGFTENPLVIPHVPEVPRYAMQEKEPPWPTGPPTPVLNMNPQTELQGASSIEVPNGTASSWDRTQTQPPWTSVLQFPQAEPQGANFEESPVPLASPELPGWEVQQIHQPCTPRHNTPPLEQTWPTTLRVPAETQEDKHHPPGSLTGDIVSMSRTVTSMPQEDGAIGKAPLHPQGTLSLGTEGCPRNKESRIQIKKYQFNPGPHSLAPSPPLPGQFLPRIPIQQDLCPLATSFYPSTCQIPAPNPTCQGSVGALSSNCAHVQAKKVMSQDTQPLHCHPPVAPQLQLLKLARDRQGPAREGREVPLMPLQTPDLQASKVPEPQSLSQYNKNMAAAKMPRAPKRARQERSGGSEPPDPDKSQAKTTLPSRKREHSRKSKTGDQGGGDAGWGVSPSKGKNHSSEGKKLSSHYPARRPLVSPRERNRNLCQTASRPELPQPSKAEISQVLPSQGPSKGQGAGGGDILDSRHQQNRPQGGRGP